MEHKSKEMPDLVARVARGISSKALNQLLVYFFENNKANDIKDVGLQAVDTVNYVCSPLLARNRRPQTQNFYIISAKIEAKDISARTQCAGRAPFTHRPFRVRIPLFLYI